MKWFISVSRRLQIVTTGSKRESPPTLSPLPRASIGILTAEQVWGEMLRDMPQGQPETGDRGLDRTHSWGRTYWGGALFCLQADVEIRKRTGNAKGLQDALRAINRAGGTIEAEWPLAKALEIWRSGHRYPNADGTLWQDGPTAGVRGLDLSLGATWRASQRPRDHAG